jgi:hypothetical protein
METTASQFLGVRYDQGAYCQWLQKESCDQNVIGQLEKLVILGTLLPSGI